MKRFINNLIKRGAAALSTAAVIVSTLSSVAFMPASALSVTSGNDCDDNAVIYCGADNTDQLASRYTNDGHNKAGTTTTIFNHFHISKAEVDAMGTTAVAGRVTKSGDVYVGTKLVATDAVTAGRQNIAGSTAVTENGITYFVRTPSVSFNSDSLNAYVALNADGTFNFAVIAACGNPVNATKVKPPVVTPPTPSYEITKTVAVKGSTDFKSDVTVPAGTHVIYRITIKNGPVAIDSINVYDKLPAGVTYVGDTFYINGEKIETSLDDLVANLFFTDGIEGPFDANESDVVEFEAVIGSDTATAACTPQVLNNVAHIVPTGLEDKTATATVNEQCVTQPQCTNLGITKGDHTVTVNGLNYALNGATFENASINWGDGTNTGNVTSVTNLSHRYSGNGPYTIIASVKFSGQDQSMSGNGCQAIVNFNTVTTAKVTTLVNTGPGSTIALFFGLSAIAAFAHRYLAIRRLTD